MFNYIKNKFNNFEPRISKLMKNGIFFSFILAIIATLILLTYIFHTIPNLFYIGTSLFKTSLFFAVEFFVCAFAMDTINKQRI